MTGQLVRPQRSRVTHEGSRVTNLGECGVELKDIVKRHGTTLAIDHVSLQVNRGEFFSILGPSGSGKTSTLRLLAGFEEPDQGEILIEGRSMQGVPPNHRAVNLVFQSYALFPHMTVAGNVGFGLEMRGVARPAIASGVRAALDMVRLTGKEDRMPSQLSGGEQQRVALARALVNRPAVVLLDEPLGALDQQLRQEMQVELKTIQEQVGLTFICVTHHQEEALTMSDRVAVMNQGRLLQVGTPREVYESPTSEFVAAFIGVSNRVSGRIERVTGARGTIRVQDLPAIVARVHEGVREGAAVTVSIRPERLHLSSDHNLDGFENTVPARIQKTIFTGNETQYLLRLTEGLIWRARVPNRGGNHKQFQAGEAVFVRWHADEGVVLSE